METIKYKILKDIQKGKGTSNYIETKYGDMNSYELLIDMINEGKIENINIEKIDEGHYKITMIGTHIKITNKGLKFIRDYENHQTS